MPRFLPFLVLLLLLPFAQSSATTIPTANEQQPSMPVTSEQPHKTHWQSFIAAFSIIVISEIGDKTFLIAAILAMNHPRMHIFLGASSALILMTALSALLGYAVPNLISRSVTQFLAACLFLVFGLKMVKEGWEMGRDEGMKELAEVEQELAEHSKKDEEQGMIRVDDEAKKEQESALMNLLGLVFSPIFVQTFVMTFLAEWGDRSQIATIALGASENVVYVTIGASIAHCLCTGAAVMGGKLLATKISVRTVTLSGGFLFILFAALSFYVSSTGQDRLPK